MHALEDDALDHTGQLALNCGHNLHILGTDNDVNQLARGKALVDTGKLLSGKLYTEIPLHHAGEDVRLPDEVGDKGILRLIIDIHRCADLLNVPPRMTTTVSLMVSASS